MTKPVDERQDLTPPAGEPKPPPRNGSPPWPARLPPLVNWPVIFAIPFLIAATLVVVYPVVYGFWMGADPDLYEDLFTDDTYLRTVWNTIVFVGLGVNLKLVLALLLSGFFALGNWWIRGLLAISLLPWAIPSVPALLSIHWMLMDRPKGNRS